LDPPAGEASDSPAGNATDPPAGEATASTTKQGRKKPRLPLHPKSKSTNKADSCISMEWQKYLHANKYSFDLVKPERDGALDLRGYTMPGTTRKPTLDDMLGLDNNDWSDDQTSFKKAYKLKSKEMNISKDENFNKYLKTFDCETSKEILIKQRDKAQEAAKTEAALHNVHMVKYLAWEPELTKVGKPMKH